MENSAKYPREFESRLKSAVEFSLRETTGHVSDETFDTMLKRVLAVVDHCYPAGIATPTLVQHRIRCKISEELGWSKWSGWRDGFAETSHKDEIEIEIRSLFEAPSAAMVCDGCGSTWTTQQLAEQKAKNPTILSCCPERKMVPAISVVNENIEAAAKIADRYAANNRDGRSEVSFAAFTVAKEIANHIRALSKGGEA